MMPAVNGRYALMVPAFEQQSHLFARAKHNPADVAISTCSVVLFYFVPFPVSFSIAVNEGGGGGGGGEFLRNTERRTDCRIFLVFQDLMLSR